MRVLGYCAWMFAAPFAEWAKEFELDASDLRSAGVSVCERDSSLKFRIRVSVHNFKFMSAFSIRTGYSLQ